MSEFARREPDPVGKSHERTSGWTALGWLRSVGLRGSRFVIPRQWIELPAGWTDFCWRGALV